MNQTALGDQPSCRNYCQIIGTNVSCSVCADDDDDDDNDTDYYYYNSGGGGGGGYAVCYIYALICIIGAVGNALVIIVVLRSAKMRSATNHYICNLAISDILFLVGLPLMIVTVVYRTWIFGSVMCKVFYILTSLNWFTSVFTLTVMSADRYLAVCHPIRSMGYRTPAVSRWTCAGVWLASVVVMLPIYFFANTVAIDGGPGADDPRESCIIKWPHDDTIPADKAFIWYAFVVGFAAPTALISIFYTLVVVRLRTAGPGTKRSQEKKKAHRKVTKMVLVVIAAYVICWLPYWIFQVSNTFMDPQEWTRTVVHVVTVLSYTNSTLNPFLYAFLAETFRKSFVKAICCSSIPCAPSAAAAAAAAPGASRNIRLEHSAPSAAAAAPGSMMPPKMQGSVDSDTSAALLKDSPVGGKAEGGEGGREESRDGHGLG